jgi:hypothetical protein
MTNIERETKEITKALGGIVIDKRKDMTYNTRIEIWDESSAKALETYKQIRGEFND